MALILGKAWQGYKILFEELVDPRTKDWFLIAKPFQVLTILGLYLMFVLKWGPNWMKNRQPFNLDKVLIFYNACQVVACSYVFIQGFVTAWGWGGDYKWFCEPVDYSNTGKPLQVARIAYCYFLLKLADLLDTVFFVLRKKFNQVSFLHIYHHTGMVLLIWAAMTYLPGGHGTFIGVINSFVHMVMYTYYMLTVAFPSVKNAIWIKKHVTQLQIVQFFWCVVHMAVIVFIPDCAFPRWTSAVFLPQNLFMLVLFIDFYIKTYIKKPKQTLEARKNVVEDQNENNDDKNKANKNGIGKNNLNVDEINGVSNNFSKTVNGHTNTKVINKSCENLNKNQNGKELFMTSFTAGKSKVNGHKQFKYE